MEDPSSYSVCDVPGHHPYPTPYIRDDFASTYSAHVLRSPRILPYPVVLSPDHDTPIALSSPLRSPDTTYTPAESADTLPLDNNIFIPVNTSTETHRILSSSDPVTTLTSSSMMIISTPEPSAYPAPSKPSTSPTDVVAVQHTGTSVSQAASGSLIVSSSASPAVVLDHMLPIGLCLPSDPHHDWI